MKSSILFSIIAVLGISLVALMFSYQHVQNCEAQGGSITGSLHCNKSNYERMTTLFQQKFNITRATIIDMANGAVQEMTSNDKNGNSMTLLIKENSDGPYYAEILCKYDYGKTEKITKDIVNYLEHGGCFRDASNHDFKTNVSDFRFIYSFGIGGKSVFDSAKNTFTADMVCDPSIEVPIYFSDAEKQAIKQVILENHFFSLGNFTQSCDKSGMCIVTSPEEITTLSVTNDGKSHIIQHRESFVYTNNEDYLRFNKITKTIEDTLYSKDSLKNIPTPRCAYE